jgi:hypothetical protein
MSRWQLSRKGTAQCTGLLHPADDTEFSAGVRKAERPAVALADDSQRDRDCHATPDFAMALRERDGHLTVMLELPLLRYPSVARIM